MMSGTTKLRKTSRLCKYDSVRPSLTVNEAARQSVVGINATIA